MIGYHEVESRIVISSRELYDSLDRDHAKYYRWIKRRVIFNSSLDVPRDYFVHRKKPLDIYMSLTLAKAILISEQTIVSRNIRRYIEEKIESNPNRKPQTVVKFTPPPPTPLQNLYFLVMPGGKRVERLRG